ncbi:Rab3 GTPase-activating protein catalytic subunit [Balamuthia mandrillaris]
MERREEGREEEEEEEKRLFSGGRLDDDDAADLRDELLATAQMEQQAAAEEEETEEDHGEEEPFEIVDYTLASPFEKFVARIENTLVKWKLSLHAYSNGERPTQGANASTPGETMLTVREVFQYDSINYQLMYQFAETEQAKGEGELSSLSPKRGSADGDRSEHALPEALQAILDGGKDFPSRAHHLQRWFGVKDFLILAPISEMGATNNQANHLLSAIAIAIQETQCPVPIFVPKDERWKGIYIGYMAHPPSNTSVRWECNMRHTTPSHWQTASPILQRFAQQFQPESAFAREENGFLEEELSNTQRGRRKQEEDICFAARHTYMRGDWEHNA